MAILILIDALFSSCLSRGTPDNLSSQRIDMKARPAPRLSTLTEGGWQGALIGMIGTIVK